MYPLLVGRVISIHITSWNHFAMDVVTKSGRIFHVVPAEDEFPEAPTGVVPRHQRDETLEHVIVRQPRQEEPVSLEHVVPFDEVYVYLHVVVGYLRIVPHPSIQPPDRPYVEFPHHFVVRRLSDEVMWRGRERACALVVRVVRIG